MAILRLYVPPALRETPEEVLQDLMAGKIGNMNVLKIRLCNSLQRDAEEGVELATVWRTLHELAPDLGELARRVGWTLPHTEVINTYKDVSARYHYATVAQVTDMFCRDPGGFKLTRTYVPNYELGTQCPTLVLRRE